MRTSDRLAQALAEADSPAWLILDAKAGKFDDYRSDSATPMIDLVRHCRRLGLNAIVRRVMAGDFDGTREEGDEWARSKQGQAALGELGLAETDAAADETGGQHSMDTTGARSADNNGGGR